MSPIWTNQQRDSRWLVWLVVSCALSLGTTVAAQSPTKADVAAWFDREWDRAQQMPNLGDGSLCWRVEFWDLPANPEKELANLREQVEGRPDHPARHQVARIERILAGNPPHRLRCLWAHNEDHWRVNTTFGNSAFADTAMAGNTVWRLSHSQLMVGTDKTQPAMQTVMSELYTFWPEVNRLVFGGLSHGVISGIRRGELRWDGREWRVTMSFGPPDGAPNFESVISGRWDNALDRGFVEREIITISVPKPETVGTEYRYSDWQLVAPLNQWIASRVEDVTPGGRVQRAYVFDSWRPGGEGDFEEVLAVPSPNATDPVRGELLFTRLVDYRRNAVRERKNAQEQFARAVPIRQPGGPSIWRSWLGWVSAAALATGLVVLYIHRRSTTH